MRLVPTMVAVLGCVLLASLVGFFVWRGMPGGETDFELFDASGGVASGRGPVRVDVGRGFWMSRKPILFFHTAEAGQSDHLKNLTLPYLIAVNCQRAAFQWKESKCVWVEAGDSKDACEVRSEFQVSNRTIQVVYNLTWNDDEATESLAIDGRTVDLSKGRVIELDNGQLRQHVKTLRLSQFRPAQPNSKQARIKAAFQGWASLGI